jgi:hypothetical protein
MKGEERRGEEFRVEGYIPTLSRHILVASVQMAKSAKEVRFVSLQDWTWSWQPFGISLANFM